ERADREPRHHDVPVAGQHERQRHRQHGGADGHEPVGPPAQLHGHEGEEHRGEREVQAVPLRALDEAAERGADRDAADERARDGGGAAEIDPRDERQRGDETVAQAARQAEPRQKNARSTNRTTPTSRIASEELQIMRRSQRVSRTSTSAGTATATTSAWPISTPALNPKSESRSPCEDSPSSRSAAEKPKPWTRPKQKLTSQRRATTGLKNRFSAATNAIDSAMTASTRRSGSTTMSSAARASVTLWASVNAVMILASANQPPPRRRRPSRNSRW